MLGSSKVLEDGELDFWRQCGDHLSLMSNGEDRLDFVQDSCSTERLVVV